MMMKFVITLLGLSCTAMAATQSAPGTKAGEFMGRFDHRGHEVRVFNKSNVACGSCHNFDVNPATGEVRQLPDYKKTTFGRDLKSICHECHKTNEVKWRNAPKGCVLCHRNVEAMSNIAPPDHRNLDWKRSHGLNSRVDSSSCMDCHTQSSCVKCHLQRNDITLSNHTRNFRLFHSVAARQEPQKCDSCHTKSFCINCHTGKNK